METTAPATGTGLDDETAALRAYTARLKGDLLRPARGLLRWPYLSAGAGETYPDLTDWDAVWAGAAYLAEGDADPLRDSLRNLLDHVRPDGKGQRRIGHAGYNAPPFQVRPFLASGCHVLARETDDTSWLGPDGLTRLDAYLRYRHVQGTGPQGLVCWRHVDEGFADNGIGNWAWEPYSVQAVDINAQLVVEHASVARLAERMGERDLADRHHAHAAALTERIDTFLWDDDAGCWFSLYSSPLRHERARHIRFLQYTNLWPLFHGLAPADKARRVIETYVLDPDHFWGPHGIRSASPAEVQFSNARRGITQPMDAANMVGPAAGSATSSNWLGPVWPVVSYLTAGALARYGYDAEARDLTERIVGLLARDVAENGCFHENYHSETGQPLAAPGIGSWQVMVPHLPDHVRAGGTWWTDGLDLPRATGA